MTLNVENENVKIDREFCVIEKALDRERRYISTLHHRTKAICDFIKTIPNGNLLAMFTLTDTESEGGNYRRDFEKYLGSDYQVHYIDGKTKKADRKRILDYVKANPTGNAIVAAKSIMARGINIPNLKYLVNISGIASDELISQSLGRVARRSDDKGNKSYVLEFIDNLLIKKQDGTILQPKSINQYRKRMSVYETLGFTKMKNYKIKAVN